MKLEFPLLSLLAAHPMTGYDVQRWMRVEGKFVGLDRHPSQIYRELGRMETEGWISHVVDPREGAPDAKIYSVTPEGIDRLRRWVRSSYVPPRRFHDPEFSIRLRAAALFDLERARDLTAEELEERRRTVRENRGRDRTHDHVAATGDHAGDVEALALVADEINQQGEAEIDSHIRWLEGLLETLTARLDARTGESAASEARR